MLLLAPGIGQHGSAAPTARPRWGIGTGVPLFVEEYTPVP